MNGLKDSLMKKDKFYRSMFFAKMNKLPFDDFFYAVSKNVELESKDSPGQESSMLLDLVKFESYLCEFKGTKIDMEKWSSDINTFSKELTKKKEKILDLRFEFNDSVELFGTLYRWPDGDTLSKVNSNKIFETQGKNVVIIRNSIIEENIAETFVFGWDTLILNLKNVNIPITGNEILEKLSYPEKDYTLVRDKLINFLSSHLVYYNSLVLST